MIIDFKEGQTVTGVFLMVYAESKETADSKPYLSAVLSDKSGNIEVKKWDFDPAHLIAKGPHLVTVVGSVTSYKGKLQLKLNTIDSYLGSEYTIADFVKAAPLPLFEMKTYLRDKLESIQSPTVKYITRYCLDKTEGAVFNYPAAKSVHHAFHSGLIYHIYGMLKIAESVIPLRGLNADYLNAGIIIHDLGKVLEIHYTHMVIGDSYTTEGQLLGHIPIVYEWILEAVHKAEEPLDQDAVLNLKHMILSHHGKLEWGSPVIPLTPEAVALHYIDNLDAHTQQINSSLEGLDKGQWSQKIGVPPFNKFYRN